MSADVLTQRALNRALLHRQLLLSRVPAAADRHDQVLATVEHLAGLQAQAPFPPYYGLWSRLDGFRPADLAELLTTRQVVRIALMRGTIHLVSARDCLLLRPLVQPGLDQYLGVILGGRLGEMDLARLAAAGRALAQERPCTFSELGTHLAEHWPGQTPSQLARAVRVLVPLVQVPPRGVWGASGQARHAPAEAWLGQPLEQAPAPEILVRRYLAAFGPATVADLQRWSGRGRLREIVARLRPGLRQFRDERGRELLDLPDAPRPDPDTPAPVRLVAEFDNLLLAHADRTRIISEPHRRRFMTVNAVIPGAVLVDGFVAGSWRITMDGETATLAIRPFEPVRRAAISDIEAEGQRLLEFARPQIAARDVRFEPVTG
ncbi:MAG TPA: winged helix DNA-binding domain-containing protein [Streptosporangiaceae bacterium]|nr:winged helix DNA-binding domain-containing protein [Streptosporangiaceae bacterium]